MHETSQVQGSTGVPEGVGETMHSPDARGSSLHYFRQWHMGYRVNDRKYGVVFLKVDLRVGRLRSSFLDGGAESEPTFGLTHYPHPGISSCSSEKVPPCVVFFTQNYIKWGCFSSWYLCYTYMYVPPVSSTGIFFIEVRTDVTADATSG